MKHRKTYDELYREWAALGYETARDRQKAIEIARELAEQKPNDIRGWDALADSAWVQLPWKRGPGHRLQANPEMAADPLFAELLDAYRHVQELDPSDSASSNNMAVVYRGAGMYLEAYESYIQEATIESSLSGDREDRDENTVWLAYWAAARAARDAGAFDLALQALEKAVAAGMPQDAADWRLAAELYSGLGRTEDAEGALRKATELEAAEAREKPRSRR